MNNLIVLLLSSLLSFSVFSHNEPGIAHQLTDPHHGSPMTWILAAIVVVAGLFIYKNKLK